MFTQKRLTKKKGVAARPTSKKRVADDPSSNVIDYNKHINNILQNVQNFKLFTEQTPDFIAKPTVQK